MSRSIPRLLSFLATFFLALCVFLSLQRLTIADDAICYGQIGGQNLDLSKLCGQVPSTAQPKAYPEAIGQGVAQYIQQNQDSVIAQAKTTCRILQYGGPQAAATQRQGLIEYQGGTKEIGLRQEAIDAYAIANYCPDQAR
jgi:hypothetical protein